jgi:nicotinamide-nucleotide adenylyltransferase
MTHPQISSNQTFARIGMVARWQPVHHGHAAVLRAMCARADQVLIGLGSSNMHTARSPFYEAETRAMLSLALKGDSNYTLISVPDLHDGPRWRLMVRDLFGELDLFLTDNPYVASLMGDLYRVAPPVVLVEEGERIPLEGRMVRLEMARGGAWQSMVPPAVAEYLQVNGLEKRFRQEFGLETLALAGATESL